MYMYIHIHVDHKINDTYMVVLYLWFRISNLRCVYCSDLPLSLLSCILYNVRVLLCGIIFD